LSRLSVRNRLVYVLHPASLRCMWRYLHLTIAHQGHLVNPERGRRRPASRRGAGRGPTLQCTEAAIPVIHLPEAVVVLPGLLHTGHM
jgi:hypothetical protein